MKTSSKTSKIVLLFGFLLVGFIFFISAIVHTVFQDRRLPTLESSKIDVAIRGNIYSSDGFHLATSKKLYKAGISTESIDPDKKEVFIKLFAIYSGVNEKQIRKILKNQKGHVILTYNLDAKTAKQLKLLAAKLNRLNVFREVDEGGRMVKYGLSIIESGEKREYLYKDSLEPVVGYIKKFEDDEITKVAGVKGIERFYENRLAPIQDGYLKGIRDVGHNVIVNKESLLKERVDGYDIHLNISLKLQKKIERIVDREKERLGAKQIMAAVMESKSGKLLALCTSNRFDPNGIRRQDYPNLNAAYVEYPFEPGSVIKPIVFSLLLEYGLINPYDSINVYNGRYRLKNKVITDTHRESIITNEEVIIISSNIGMAILAQKLSPINYAKGMQAFGFTQESGLDLPYQRNGVLPHVNQLKDEIYKATLAYGYGMQANMMQILRAYNAFNNNGVMINPRIAGMIEDQSGRRYLLPEGDNKQVISVVTAKKMQQILIKTVQKGTGKKADVEGLSVGGKTGTAHIAEKGQYVDKYNSSFFGFANDEKQKYTIGVVVFEPNAEGEYFASQTAVPVFKRMVDLLIEEHYLVPVEKPEED